MKRKHLSIIALLASVTYYGQTDTIQVKAKVLDDGKTVRIEQKILYHNPYSEDLNKIKLLNWIAAYKNRKTPLLKRKLQDRKKELYFTTKENLGYLKDLTIAFNSKEILNLDTSRENLYLPLTQPLKNGERVEINLNYTLELPLSEFTKYGRDKENIAFKYFLIVPDTFDDAKQKEKYYLDIEEVQNSTTFWNISWEAPSYLQIKSNLNSTSKHQFEGLSNSDPEFLLTPFALPEFKFTIDNAPIKINLGYDITEKERQYLEFFLPLQLKFIKDKIGKLPAQIFISEKLRKEENFMGNDDIKFWKFRYQLFSEEKVVDMDYFPVLAKSCLNQLVSYNKNENHWLINGLKTYLEIQYIHTFYGKEKLLGELPNQVQLFGTKPLKLFNASKLNLSDRYGLGYRYIQTENLDQKIKTPFSELSNMNKTMISNFEMGSLLNFVAEKMGKPKFEIFLRNYLASTENKEINSTDFLQKLKEESDNSSGFIENIVNHKQRINFNLRSFKEVGNKYEIKISKAGKEHLPLKLETENKDGSKTSYWLDSPKNEETSVYTIASDSAKKIIVNSNYIFPESNDRDNYLYTTGLFSNTKKPKIKFFRDFPNPEYNEIYLNPKINFNAYDKLMLGINFKNSSLFKRRFTYSITPYYSFGSSQFTGSAATAYTFMPPESFFRYLQFGLSGAFYHYDYDLTYRRITASTLMNFTKNPRSDVNRSLGFSYSYFEKDLNEKRILNNEYGKYNLWNLNYNYINQRLIHESHFGTGIQGMEDFQKISAEYFHRYEFAKNKKISFRIFAGTFISNKTKNNTFDFGVSKVSNYSFSYGLIGQSATSGLLSQQLILADGGFKSYVTPFANQWITSINVDSNVWKWFNVYADAGVFKNKGRDANFIWDSGVKVALLPDFLEIYLPVQSSLGFEPSFKDYASRIRFTLVLNFGAIGNYFRRGVF